MTSDDVGTLTRIGRLGCVENLQTVNIVCSSMLY
jgi:hypothetical protein